MVSLRNQTFVYELSRKGRMIIYLSLFIVINSFFWFFFKKVNNMSMRYVVVLALCILMIIPSYGVSQSQTKVSHHTLNTLDKVHVNSAEQVNPILANLSLRRLTPLNSSIVSSGVAQHDGTQVMFAAFRDSIVALSGAKWIYELCHKNGSFDAVLSVTTGDVNGDRSEEIIVRSRDGYLYCIDSGDGELLFKRITNLDTLFNKILVCDVVKTSGSEIIVYSENSNKIHVFSSEGYYLGEIRLQTIDDIEYIVCGEMNTGYTGQELCVLGYDMSTGYYYIAVLNIYDFPEKDERYAIYPTSLGTNFITGYDPSDVYGIMYIENLTAETGNEMIIAGVITYSVSSVRIVVYNSSGQISTVWSSPMSIGSSREWVKLWFYDIDDDSALEILVGTRDFTAIVQDPSTYTTILHHPEAIVWDEGFYYNAAIMNVSAILIYTNISDYVCYVGILNISATTTFDLMSKVRFTSDGTMSGSTVYTIIRDQNLYLLRPGKAMKCTVSGLNINIAEHITVWSQGHYLKQSSILYDDTQRIIEMNLGWVRVLSLTGDVELQYVAENYRELYYNYYSVDLGDYVPQEGYELAVFEVVDSNTMYLKIVSSEGVVKTINVSMPAYNVYGMRLLPPPPGSSKALIILYNYSADEFVAGILDTNSGSITIGASDVPYGYGTLMKTDTGYCYLLYNYGGQSLYILDPEGANIVGILNIEIEIYDVWAKDLDMDGADELIVCGYDGGVYTIYLIEDDFSKYTIDSGSYVSISVVICDLFPEDGYEIIYHDNNYLHVYNPVSKEIIDSYYTGVSWGLPLSNYPVIKVNDDVVIWLVDLSAGRSWTIRFLQTMDYHDISMDTKISFYLDAYRVEAALCRQQNIGNMLQVLLINNKGTRYAIGTLEFDVDLEDPRIEYACPSIIESNISGYAVAINETLSIAISVEDDLGLSYASAQITFRDVDNNYIATDNWYWELEGKVSENFTIDVEAPEGTYYIYLQISAEDLAGRSRTISRTAILDLYAPTIMPQISDEISVRGDEEIIINAYIGDDVGIRRVYIEFDGYVIPMKTSEEIEPEPGMIYYYTAKVYIKKFDGEKTLKIVAEDFAGRRTEYSIIVKCKVPLQEKPLFITGVMIGIAAGVAAIIYILVRKFYLRKESE